MDEEGIVVGGCGDVLSSLDLSQFDFSKLLSEKDAQTENFLNQIVSLLKLPINATPDEIHVAWSRQLSNGIAGISSILWHRLNPYVEILLARKMHNFITDQMVTIDVIQEPLLDLCNKYRVCFTTWIDSDKILFNTGMEKLLGKLSLKNYFILQFFVFGTNTRVRGDHCLQLGIVGKSSVGKSTLFESPLSEISHYYVSDKGTGRFKIEEKTILFFHDIDVRTMVFSRDKDLIKTLARSEASQAKVHSSTGCIPPIHILYTSNFKLFNYKLPTSSAFSGHILSDIPMEPRTNNHVDSFRKRFIECFCYDRPTIDTDWLPIAGMFQKQHMIMGMYDRVIDILMEIDKSDFYKLVQVHYILAGLAKHWRMYETIYNIPIREKIIYLVEKFLPHPYQRLNILRIINK